MYEEPRYEPYALEDTWLAAPGAHAVRTAYCTSGCASLVSYFFRTCRVSTDCGGSPVRRFAGRLPSGCDRQAQPAADHREARVATPDKDQRPPRAGGRAGESSGPTTTRPGCTPPSCYVTPDDERPRPGDRQARREGTEQGRPRSCLPPTSSLHDV